jgi:hypothetical protein
METATTTAKKGYSVLANGTDVEVVRGGALVMGKVAAVHFNPNRKLGIGRVSYDVEVGRFGVIRVPAKDVTEVGS